MQHERGERTFETPFTRFECSILERANKPASSRAHESVITRLMRVFQQPRNEHGAKCGGGAGSSHQQTLFSL